MLRRLPKDPAIALIAAVVLQLDLWLIEGVKGTAAVTVVSALLFAVSLAWRRANPMLMVALAFVALVAGAALGGELTETITVAATGMGIVFSAAVHLGRRRSALAVAAFAAATWADLLIARDPDHGVLSDIAFTSLIVVAGPYLTGRALRDRRERTDQLEGLTEQLRADRDLRARMAVLDERARIAREMHDVVAHSVSLMVVQTGAARALLDDDPEQTRAALLAVEDAGRDALGELRRTLGVMRGTGTDAIHLSPQPGLGQLETLVARAREAGLPVSLEVSGTPRPLPAGADLAAYRIVQEALTNAVKHAGAASATVTVGWRDAALELEIRDTGRGANGPAPPDSHGLIGMRERVALYGGSMDAGGAEGGGFVVRARIPVQVTPA